MQLNQYWLIENRLSCVLQNTSVVSPHVMSPDCYTNCTRIHSHRFTISENSWQIIYDQWNWPFPYRSSSLRPSLNKLQLIKWTHDKKISIGSFTPQKFSLGCNNTGDKLSILLLDCCNPHTATSVKISIACSISTSSTPLFKFLHT